MKTISLLLLMALLGLPQPARAEAYKCKQPDGSLSFQDHPCAAGATGSAVDLPSVQGYSPGSLGPSGALTPRTPARAQAGRIDLEARAYNAAVLAENKQRRCTAARQQLGVMKEQRPVFTRDNAGNRVYIEDKDRPAAISAAQERVEADCP